MSIWTHPGLACMRPLICDWSVDNAEQTLHHIQCIYKASLLYEFSCAFWESHTKQNTCHSQNMYVIFLLYAFSCVGKGAFFENMLYHISSSSLFECMCMWMVSPLYESSYDMSADNFEQKIYHILCIYKASLLYEFSCEC